MSTFRTSSNVALASLLAGGLAACGIEYNPVPIPQYVEPDEAVCIPVEIDGFAPTTGATAGGALGTAVAQVTWGNAANITQNRSAAAGAPDHGQGRVYVDDALVDGTLLGVPQELTPPMGATDTRFGAAMLAADIRDGFPSEKAFGEELIIGAPGNLGGDIGDDGTIFWYYGDELNADHWTFGDSFQPAGLPPGANFGAAIAAPKTQPGVFPDYLAVGAPGADTVYLLVVNPFVTTGNMVVRQVINAPASAVGGNFGLSLAFGEVDGDGLPDLIVGAPDAGRGRFFVYRHALSGTTPYPSVPLEETGIAGGGLQELGAALATGHFMGRDLGRDAVLVGMPGRNGGGKVEVGGVCQYMFDQDGSASRLRIDFMNCFVNDFGSDFDRMGEAVAVGNFNALDLNGSSTSIWATIEEVAIGMPGDVANTGVVQVWPTDEDGAWFGDGSYTDVFEFIGPHGGARFGAALDAGFIQDEQSFIWEDLVVGTPGFSRGIAGRGSFTVTKALLASPTANLSGTWTTTDSTGATVSLTVADTTSFLTLTPLTPMTLNVVRAGTATLCTDDGTATGTPVTVILPVGTGQTFTWDPSLGVGSTSLNVGGVTITAVIALVGSNLVLTISETGPAWSLLNLLNGATCTIVGNPFTLTQTSSNFCE